MDLNIKSRLIQILSVLGDCLVVICSVILSMRLTGVYANFCAIAARHIVIFLVLIFFNFLMFELYSPKAENVYHALLSVGISLIITYIIAYIISVSIGLEPRMTSFWGYIFVSLVGGMLLWRMFVALAKKKFGKKRTLLIIENMSNTSRLARKLKYASNEENRSWYHVLDETDEDEIQKLMDETIEQFDAIFISPSISNKVASRLLYRALMLGKDANILADAGAVTTLKGRIYQIDDTPVIIKKGIQLNNLQKFVKRGFDIVFALILCIVTLPIFLVCAIAIKLDSEGPVFYKQERYTIHKRIFKVYKFRTMFVDAEKNGAQLATEDDPRITRVGKVLRALRLDELPQLYNILFGSMSVVGPRPERPIFADEFSKSVESYDMRYCLKAGLTGYAQVYGRYNTRVSDKILMDIIYGTTYSFLLDIKLILLTVKIMFIKSATEGVDEEMDTSLASSEKEEQRRNASIHFISGIENQSKKDAAHDRSSWTRHR